VKQIIGGSLSDIQDQAEENFTARQDAGWFAGLYKKDGLKGGHIILLNGVDSPFFSATKKQAMLALEAYPKGLQIGGGITAENAKEYIDAGASHVIVTSYIFQDGCFLKKNLEKLVEVVGRKHIIIDLSCRKRDGAYYVVTNRWQQFSKEKLTVLWMEVLAEYCDGFLVHGVDVEGKSAGMEVELVRLLSRFTKRPVTYAGGIGSLKDLKKFEEESKGRLDFTIGSALDIFGGNISYGEIAMKYCD